MIVRATLYVWNRSQWRTWLKKHHRIEKEIWLIYYKGSSGKPQIPYNDAVEEALCFGWIDSLVQRIDDERYMQKFTPRKPKSKWSAANVTRVERMIREGRMTPAGLAVYDAARVRGMVVPEKRPKYLPVPAFMKDALKAHPPAWQKFTSFASSYKRNYIAWISAAKGEETRQKRLIYSIALIVKGEKLGLK